MSKIEIPTQLQKPELRFIPLKGKRPLLTDWTHTNFSFDDTFIQKSIASGRNYGVCTGIGNLLVIDVDHPTSEFLDEIKKKLPPTFVVQTGKKGYHFYYFTDKPLPSRKIDVDTVHIDIQGQGKQVVGPTSIHPETQRAYKIVDNRDIAHLSTAKLFDFFGKYLVKQVYSNSRNYDPTKLQQLLDKILNKVSYEDKGSYILINCPFHPPDLHPSFAIYKNTFLGYDFHNDQVYLLKDVATKLGILTEHQPKTSVMIMEKFNPVRFADIILQRYIFLLDKYQRFFRYDPDDGVWHEDAEVWLRAYIRRNLFGDEGQKTHYVNEVVDYIRDISYQPITFESPANIIAFENVAIDINTGEKVQLKPEYHVTNKIPVIFDESQKECPRIDKFFTEIVGEERKDILYDLVGYTLYKRYPYQKVFYLYGSGGNGKSTFLDLLTTFLGQYNVSSETPQDLISNRFSAGNLFNKLANISSDISYELLKNPNKIKMLSGGDFINCERKFERAFPFRNFAKLIFSTNMLPPTNDKSYAYYRRLYLIEFSKKFTGDKANRTILSELTTPNELSGLAWKGVEHLLMMKKRGWKFTFDPKVEDIMEKYEKLSNPVHMFVEENCVEDIEGYIFVSNFYNDFKLWSRNKGFPLLGNNEITRSLSELGYSKKQKGPQNHWAFIGLRWKRELNDFSEKENGNEGVVDKKNEMSEESIINEILKQMKTHQKIDELSEVMKEKGIEEEKLYQYIYRLHSEGKILEVQKGIYVVVE